MTEPNTRSLEERAAEAFVRSVATTAAAPPDDVDPARLARLEAALQSLPTLERQIFLAHRLDAMSYAAIAKVTGLSIRQVEKAMVRALRGISRHLRGEPPRRRRWWRW